MDNNIYYGEEEVEKLLIEDFCVAKKVLENDVKNSKLCIRYNRVHISNIYSLQKLDGSLLYVCDICHDSIVFEGQEYRNIAEVLDEIKDVVHFLYIWEKYKYEIAVLFRAPGGYHEWLTVANIYHLRMMNISLKLVGIYRTSIEGCFFFVREGEYYEKFYHGRKHSTEMHNCLYRAIERAHDKCADENSDKNAIKFLYESLMNFVNIYYPEEREKPAELNSLLECLRNRIPKD